MDFPPNIKLSKDAEDRLRSYLDTEIQNHRAERGDWVDDLTNLQVDYWAKPSEEVKTFPFKGACNIVIPLTAIAVEAVHAREMTTLFALDQFTTLKLPSQFEELTSDTEKVIDNVLLKQLDIYKFADNSLLENKKLGSAIGKTGYEKIIKRAIKYVGTEEIPFDVISKQGATVDSVPLPWFEIWLSFDVDGDGKDEEIVVHFHWESQSFFSIRYNWYSDLHRPYEIGNYFPMENRWAGIGIGKQVEQFQMEATTLLRQRIDNGTLSNMRMYKIKQGIGYGPDEPIFPGKIWLVEEADDISEIVMNEIYPSGYNNEQQAVIYSNQRTGV
jgi:hypothetical protein